MKTLTTLTAVAVALCALGCEAIVLEKGPKPSTQQISTLEPTVDPYEPDGGGQNMTPSAPQYIYYHTIYPAGDVDFRYMESVGAYTVTIWSWRAPLRVRVWTRASKLHGPSTLVADNLVGEGQHVNIPFTLTTEQGFVVVRVEAAPDAGWTVHAIRFVAQTDLLQR